MAFLLLDRGEKEKKKKKKKDKTTGPRTTDIFFSNGHFFVGRL